MITLTQLLIFLPLYFAFFYLLSRTTQHWGSTKTGYLVANRDAALTESTLGIIGCWLTGLALLVSGQQFYVNGWVGYFWFTAPQIVGFLLFAYLTTCINQRVPNGFTTSSWIRDSYGATTGTIFQVVFILACLGNLATTFTALFKYIDFVDIGNTALITGIIVVGTALYGVRGGIKTSLLTGAVQTVINIVLAIVLIWLGWHLVQDRVLTDFVTGQRNVTDLFDPGIMIAFGITMALTFVTGPLMSATHHQKSYAQQNRAPWKAWALAAPGYLAAQTLVAFFGIMALAWGGAVPDVSVNQLYFFQAAGVAAVIVFGILLLNIACIIIDAHGNAIASVVAHDFVRNDEHSVLVARITMVAIAVIVWLIALQNWDLTKIFFAYGVLRVNLFLILIMILTTTWLSSRGIVWSTMTMLPATVLIGLHGIYTAQPWFNVVASAAAFFLTPALALLVSRLGKR